MSIIYFIVLLGLIIWSVHSNDLPTWVPTSIYILIVLAKAYKVTSNYYDDKKQSELEEDREQKYQLAKLHSKGAGDSSVKHTYRERIKEKYELQRKKNHRQFFVDLAETLLLK